MDSSSSPQHAPRSSPPRRAGSSSSSTGEGGSGRLDVPGRTDQTWRSASSSKGAQADASWSSPPTSSYRLPAHPHLFNNPHSTARITNALGFGPSASGESQAAPEGELAARAPALGRRPSFSRSPHSLPPTIPLPAVPSSHPQATVAPSSWTTSPVTRSFALPTPTASDQTSPADTPSPSQRSSWALDVPGPSNGRPPSSYSGSLALMAKSVTRRKSSLGLGDLDQPDGPSPPTSRTPSLKRRPSYSPTPPPTIPLPALPPSSPHSLQPLHSPSSSVHSYSSSQTQPRPSSGLYNPPPHPPPSGPLPTLPKGPSTFRGRGRNGSIATAYKEGDSPLRGVYGDGSTAREFFASSPSGPLTPDVGGESSSSLSREEREKLLAQGRKDRRFDLREGNMLNARIITDSKDGRPISPLPPPPETAKPLPAAPAAPSQSVIPPSPPSAITPKPSALLIQPTPTSPSPRAHPLLPPLPQPILSNTSTPKSSTGADSVALSMTSPSTSSEYSNRSSTFSTVSSRSSVSSYGHLLPSVTLLQPGASKKPSLPIVEAEETAEEQGSRSESPDVKDMRKLARRRESGLGGPAVKEETEDDDGWADSLVDVYLTAQDSEDSDGDLTSPLSNLQTHFLSPNARLSTLPPRRASVASSMMSIPLNDTWGASSADDTSASEDDFAPISPQDRLAKGKGRSSLPTPSSLSTGMAGLVRRKMSSSELLGSFPRPPSTPTGSRPPSFTSAASSPGSPYRRQRESTVSSHSTSGTATASPPPSSFRRTSDASGSYFSRRSPGRPMSSSSDTSSLFSVGGRMLPLPRKGSDNPELGDVWGGVEVPHEVAGGGVDAEKSWEKAAELLRERKALSVQVGGAGATAHAAGLRRVASVAAGEKPVRVMPTPRKVSNGDVEVAMRAPGPSGGAARQLGPPSAFLNRKPLPSVGGQGAPPPASGIPVTTPVARRTASTSQLRPPSAAIFPAVVTPARTSSIAFPRPAPSGLRPPSQRTPSSSLPPPSSLPTSTRPIATPAALPPTEPLRIIKKAPSSATLRPPSMISFASSASGSTIPPPGGKRRMSKVPLLPPGGGAFVRVEGEMVLRGP